MPINRVLRVLFTVLALAICQAQHHFAANALILGPGEIVQLHPLQPRLVAIGDVHGDIDNFKSILMHGQLIDCDGNWVGEDATVIQMGDVCDRGPHTHSVIEYIDDVLIPEARRAGGEFIQMLGNHELLTMRADHRFTTPEEIEAFGGLDRWTHEFSTNGTYGARNAKLPTIVVRNGTAFVHAGLLPDHAEKGIEWVNKEMTDMMVANDWNHPFSSLTSPVWTRDQVYAAMRKKDCTLLKESLRKLTASEERMGRLPVRRLVVGHTIQPLGAMSVFCDGAFIATDVSSSQYMAGGGHLTFLEFRRRAAVGADGKMPVRFAHQYTRMGKLEGHDKPLTEAELLYIELLNEQEASPMNPLDIVGIPTYPTIPWKRHLIRKAVSPLWISVAGEKAIAQPAVGGNAAEGNGAPPKLKQGQQQTKLGDLKQRIAAGAGKVAATIRAAVVSASKPLKDADAHNHADMDDESPTLDFVHIVVFITIVLFIIFIVSGKGSVALRTWMRRRGMKPAKATV